MKVHAQFCLASLVAVLAAGCGGGGGAGSPDALATAPTSAKEGEPTPVASDMELTSPPGPATPVFTDTFGVEEALAVQANAAVGTTLTAAVATPSLIGGIGTVVDFEAPFSTMPAGWSINWWGTKASYTVVRESRPGFAYGGSAALRLRVGPVSSGSGVNLVYGHPFEKDASYGLGLLLRTDFGQAAKVEVQLRRDGKPYDVVARRQLVLGGDWQPVNLETVYPFADPGSLRIISLTVDANVYVDDVSVTRRTLVAALADTVRLAAAGGSSIEVTPVKVTTMDEAYTSFAPGWTYNYWGGIQRAAYAASRETAGSQVYAGAAAQKWQVTNKYGGEIHLVSKFPFVKGKTYRAVAYLKSDVATPVQVMMRRDVSPYDSFASRSVTVGESWQQVELEGTYLGTEEGSLRIDMKSPTGTIWVDQVSISEVKRNDFAPHDSTAAIQETLFGMHVIKLGTHDKWPGMNTRILRLWNTGTTWRDLEPTKGGWNWVSGGGIRLDMYVAYVAKHQPTASILYTLGQTPRWASTTPDVAGLYGPGASGAPRDMQDWRNYVRTLARRYAGKIRYWEIWNEPDYKPHWLGTATQLVEMTRIAREELLAADPANKLVSPGLTKGPGMVFLDHYLAAGGGNYVDIIGNHWYYWTDPEMAGPGLDNMRNVMKVHGVQSKPIWITEGAFVCDVTQTDCSTAVPTPAQLRSVNARAMFTMAVKGVGNFNYHVWEASDTTRKLVEADLTTPTEAGSAFAEARSWANGSRITDSFVAGKGVHVVRLNRAGTDSFVLWTTAPGEFVTIPAEWSVGTVRTLMRSQYPLPGTRQIELGLEPVLLTP